jgi:nitroreductase/NAD-dependent dihydropyrimidine dehydrogenase PreA subunit
MNLFTVDPELCVEDGICEAECPRFVIDILSEEPFPLPAEGANDNCINCGHCVAVCPTGALSLSTLMPDDCAEVIGGLLPSSQQVDHFLRTRRSTRTFQQKPVPKEVVAHLIDLARYAPSSSNRQPVEWLIVYANEEVQRISALCLSWLQEHTETPSLKRSVAAAESKGRDLVCRGAPHMVLAHTPDGRQTDGVIALTYLELAAYSLGVGACWCGYASSAINGSQALRDSLGLPRGSVSSGVLLLGFPEYGYHRIPARNPAQVVWR